MNEEDRNLEDLYEYFTLDVFSFIDIDLKELPYPIIDKQYTINGVWKNKN